MSILRDETKEGKLADSRDAAFIFGVDKSHANKKNRESLFM
jgi:hypothetical protein